MGELIRREAASAPLPFSGERLTAAVAGHQVEIEHYHRYLLARDFCRDRDVLDVASGEGYGTALLAQVARSAVGVEIDPAVVAAARAEFARPNLRYEQGDARALPLPDASVDVVVSFETLEHILEQDVFIGELRRVLRPGGLLVMSTPDRDVYSAAGMPPNPYHVLELTRAEFEVLLRRHFAHAVFAMQRPLIGSVVIGAHGAVASRFFERRGDTHIEADDHLPRAPYLLGLASDGDLQPLPVSVYIHRSDLDTDMRGRADAEMRLGAAEAARADAEARAEAARSAVDAEKSGGEAARAEAKAQAETARAEAERSAAEAGHRLSAAQEQAAVARNEAAAARQGARAAAARAERAERRIAELERQGASVAAEHSVRESAHQAAIGRKEEELASVAAGATHAEENLQAVFRSTSWRMTAPLRRAGSRSPTLARYARRGVKLAWWTLTLQLPRRYRAWRGARGPAPRSAAPARLGAPAEAAPPTGDGGPPPLRAPITLACSEAPLVSVIIAPVDDVNSTWRCLASIAAHPPRSPVEVIVVNDARLGPNDVNALARVQGIRLIRNDVAEGRVPGRVLAARIARGEFLHFLGDMAEVAPGALDALVDLLEARPKAGMAGSKLLAPRGRMRQAGGIVWDDASGTDCGQGDDPGRPEHNYVREVDYCSCVSIMVRRSVFESVDGFDDGLSPGFLQDADLAFRVRAKGLSVLFEPLSVVICHEDFFSRPGATRDLGVDQPGDAARFLDRWSNVLSREHFAPHEHELRARDRGWDRKVILIVDHMVPEPDRDAGSRSSMGILRSLVDAGWVVKLWPYNRAYNPSYTPPLEALGVEVLDQRWPGDLGTWMRGHGGELDHVMLMRPEIAEAVLPEVTRGYSRSPELLWR